LAISSGISGGDVSGVLNLGTISGNVTNAINQLPKSPQSDETRNQRSVAATARNY
jgi:hypothetical protein